MSQQFRSLHAWRGVAAIIVALSHFNTVGYIGGGLLAANAARLVDFFFVLSGFVIAHAYRERLQQGEVATFLLRRLGRLYPLHLVTLATVVVMASAGSLAGLSIQGWTWSSLPAALTLTHAWGFLDRNVWNGPSWSISTEAFAYLLFAVMAWRLPKRMLDVACLVVLALCAVVVTVIVPASMNSTHDYGLVRCLFGFMAGVLANSVWRGGFRPRGEIIAFFAATGMVLYLPETLEPLLVPLFAWVVLVFAGDAGPASRLLGLRLPRRLGTVSYSIYMIHYPIGVALMAVLLLGTDLTAEVDGLATVVAPWWIADALSLGFLAITLGLSQVTYEWIEKPGRALFNRRGEPIPAAW